MQWLANREKTVYHSVVALGLVGFILSILLVLFNPTVSNWYMNQMYDTYLGLLSLSETLEKLWATLV